MPHIRPLNRRSESPISLLSTVDQRMCYIFPESQIGVHGGGEDLVFQYWPETFDDSYTPDYAMKQVPGGSHPLFQWTGGSGRDISFIAQFTAEVDEGPVGAQRPNLTNVTPSARYNVDVRGALSKLRSFMLPSYTETGQVNSLVAPPKRLILVMEGTGIGGNKDYISCILRGAPITYEALFPSGHPRIVSVSLTFSEIVQQQADTGSSITFIGRESFEQDGRNYRYRGTVDRTVG